MCDTEMKVAEVPIRNFQRRIQMKRLAGILSLLGLVGMPASAQIYAVPTPFCGGRLVVELFNTQVTPGPQGRADYPIRLFNTGSQTLRARVEVVGDVLNGPTGEVSITGNQRGTMSLGYSLNKPGRQPLRGDALANAVRISCL